MQSGNLYLYCYNNPVAFWDPSGDSLREVADFFKDAWSSVKKCISESEMRAFESSYRAAQRMVDPFDQTDKNDPAFIEAVFQKMGRNNEVLSMAMGLSGGINNVYVSKAVGGATQYVGITNNIARHQLEHLAKSGLASDP